MNPRPRPPSGKPLGFPTPPSAVLPPRGRATGRVLVVGGSEEYAGAPYLAGIAALRAGAESVVVMAPEQVAWAINALSPDLMTRKLPGRWLSRAHERAIRRMMKTADILLVGNGAGVLPGTAALMRSLMLSPLPKVVDADALKVLRGNAVRNAILTPNAGEWALLEKNNDIEKLLAAKNVIVRRGPRRRYSPAHGRSSCARTKAFKKRGPATSSRA